MTSQFTIGCDPEFFLKKRATGKLISAIPFVRGTKDKPMPLPLGGNIQRDNVAVEVATDPAMSGESFVEYINNTLNEAVKTLPEDTEIVAVASASFDKEQLTDPESQEFGCDPDFCAWELRQNEKPFTEDITFRSCGAHIHVGTTGNDENSFLLDPWKAIEVVKAMDCLHGLVSTILDSSKEAIDRRKLYGKPGSHRMKPEYGVEYRVLSNYWLKSPVTVMLMYNLTEDALKVVRDGKLDELVDALDEYEIRRVIIEGDSTSAIKMIDNHVMGHMSAQSIHYLNEAIEKIKKDDMHFHKEWNLYKEAAK